MSVQVSFYTACASHHEFEETIYLRSVIADQKQMNMAFVSPGIR